MKKILSICLVLVMLLGFVAISYAKVNLILWTKEGEEALDWNKSLNEEFMKLYPDVTIEMVKKTNVEILREDFLTASLAGAPPDILWTVSDHAGPFVAAEIIEPVDDLFDLNKYVESSLNAVKLEGKYWGVPISNGNQLMLLYNKKLIAQPPKDTDELFKVGKELTSDDIYALVWNQTEPFWMVPWLGGFKGKVFAEDGITPTLNTPEMLATLKFLHAMKFDAKIIPPESDYDAADTLFKEGKAAMIINGDWSVSGYVGALGDSLGVARIPKVSATGEWPKPYTSGVYFMLSQGISGDKLKAAQDFVEFVSTMEKQLEMVKLLNRLPALKAALDDPLITEDLLLKGAADQMVVGTPMPTVLEMRCNWDSMKPEMLAVLADIKTPEEAVKDMQASVESCVKTLE